MLTLAWVLVGVAVAVPAYAYLLYPAVLYVVGRFRRGAATRGVNEPPRWPAVTLTMPVYNEEAEIAASLDALLAVDYPRDQLQILVISDASTDRTDAIALGYRDRGVKLVRLPKRGGKTAAENLGRAHVRGEIVVSLDATIRIHPGAIKAIVAPFADPSVGVVSGRDVSVARREVDSNVGEAGYVGYEMWVRDLETRLYGIIGASGCFYAVRRELHGELVPEALSRDFAAALIARERGFRSVSEPRALCFVPRTTSLEREYRRKVRTMTRGLETLFYKGHLLNPFRYGVFAWMLASHKLARWLVPWAIAVGLVGLAGLAVHAALARWILAAGAAALAVALAGWRWRALRIRSLSVASMAFVLAGLVAGVEAWIKALSGELNPVWEPTRRDAG
jgi:cellulose synthase/poly-beta-1,6-N-acetylglucosamine synthase-like glycosyltransferase